MLEFFLLVGLEQVIEGVHRKGVPYIFRGVSHEYDQHLRVGLPQSAGGLDTVGARHADIQKHHGVQTGLCCGAEKIISAGKPCALGFGQLLLQQLLQPLGVRGLILYDGDWQCHPYTLFLHSLHLYYSILRREGYLLFCTKRSILRAERRPAHPQRATAKKFWLTDGANHVILLLILRDAALQSLFKAIYSGPPKRG